MLTVPLMDLNSHTFADSACSVWNAFFWPPWQMPTHLWTQPKCIFSYLALSLLFEFNSSLWGTVEIAWVL